MRKLGGAKFKWIVYGDYRGGVFKIIGFSKTKAVRCKIEPFSFCTLTTLKNNKEIILFCCDYDDKVV